jgi:CRISPR-associated endonuclease/helicase Cas3
LKIDPFFFNHSMPAPDYSAFFQAATGNAPYDYQRRLAEDATLQSRLISIPTGLDKTAAVILAWLGKNRTPSSI